MGLKFNAKAREVDILLNKKAYRREAVTLAAAVFAQKVDFFVGRENPNAMEVFLRAKDDVPPAELRGLAGEFLNEALNQELRLDLARENAEIIKLLIAQALACARGAEASKSDAQAEKKASEDAERLMNEIRAEARK